MTYKNILLAVLLMPLTLLGNETDAQAQLAELKFKKEMELSELGKTIAERYLYTRSTWKEAINILRAELEKKNLNEQERGEFGRAVDENLVAFIRTLNNEKNVNNFLIKELFRKSENDQIEENFDAIKFFLLIIVNEYRLIKTLIQRYEVLEQERREINQKLIAFNQ